MFGPIRRLTRRTTTEQQPRHRGDAPVDESATKPWYVGRRRLVEVEVRPAPGHRTTEARMTNR